MRASSRHLPAVVLLLVLVATGAGAIGVSFSYFLPLPVDSGIFSHPVSPLSLRDIGVNFGKYFGLSTSIALYNFNGLGLRDSSNAPIDTGGPLFGPLYTALGSLVGKVMIPVGPLEIVAQGGLFGFANLNLTVQRGNLERYLAAQGDYKAVYAPGLAASQGRWGWGYLFGGRLTYYLGRIGLSVGANYYLGGAPVSFTGTYLAYDQADAPVASPPLPAALSGARLSLTGLELIVGGSYKM